MSGKKILLFVTSIIVTFVLFFSCQNFIEEQGNGTLLVKTPNSISTKAIDGIYPPDLTSYINAGNIRYEIVIESNGKKITGAILKNSDSTSISVPAGVRLNIYVGIYFVEPNSNNELINTYFVTDKKDNVIVMPNQTIYLDFTLNLNNPNPVVCYANLTETEFSGSAIYEITGITDYPTAQPDQIILTYKNLVNGNFNISGFLDGFSGINSSNNPEGKVFKVADPESSNGYGLWYLDTKEKRIRFESGDNSSSIGSIYFTDRNLPQKNPNYLTLLNKIDRVFSVMYGETYYFFLLYKEGMLSIKNESNEWGSLSKIDFSNISTSYSELPFILDIEQVTDGDTLFASKIGLFYVDQTALKYFSDELYKEAMNRLKRLIRIPDPFDKRKSLLITAVKTVKDDIYLGTRYGIYKIDKTSSKWNSFASKDPAGGYSYLDESAIEKIKEFGNVNVTDIYDTYTTSSEENIIVITTTKSILFQNMHTGIIKEFTVWDGLPFIPARKLMYNPGYSNTDYYEHGISPIRNVIYYNNRYWIATMHGLASIAEGDIF